MVSFPEIITWINAYGHRCEKADPEDVAARAVAVPAVVEEGDTVAWLGEVREAVRDHLEARCVPGGVAMGGPPCDAVHSLEARFVRAHGQGEERPQENLPLVPFHTRL